MKILFTICGRAGSKGIKNKNIKNFVGKPLPYYTLSAIDLYLSKHPEVDYDIVVNSDSKELLKMMKSNNMRQVELIVRKASLAGDVVGKIDVIRNCLDEMEIRNTTKYDMIVDLDITSPLRTVKNLDDLISTHWNKNPDLTTSVTLARRNPYFNQLMRTEQGVKRVIASNYTARQQAPDIYDMNASLYAYSIEHLRSGKGVLDGYCEVIQMMDTGILDLDHENDFELMEVIAQYLFDNNAEFQTVRENIK
ncbi:MAG: acylneuraminate cytidylyltransferase family protein [Lachnospiraceae bacterium]|nr:acylneuraminate cytidylyltransferase family protein [Lachnospiraceae bacterium]